MIYPVVLLCLTAGHVTAVAPFLSPFVGNYRRLSDDTAQMNE